ncbi:MAG: O-antigen ligase family protein, partial [Nitrospira sp.]|nr:O-antigen ligase family protein [Nitrospira sp.]
MYVALFGVVLQGVRSSQQIWQISMVIVSMGVVEAGLGIAQYLWLAEFRSKGTFFNPNFFATYEVVTLSVLLGLLSGVQKGDLNRWQWVFLWSAVGIMCAAFVMAQSRGALMALVVAMIFIGCARFGGRALIVVILSLLAGAVIPNPLQQRVQDVSVQDPYAYSRMDIWKSSFDRVVDRPLGAGLGMYKYTSFQFRFPIESNIVRYGKRAESAHNEYLQMAVELGVGGLALFVIGALYWAREVKATLGANLESWERGLVTGLSGGVVAILAH